MIYDNPNASMCKGKHHISNGQDGTITDGTIQKSNIKIVERGQISTLSAEIHDRSLFPTSIING
jgi:hypothetical protein